MMPVGETIRQDLRFEQPDSDRNPIPLDHRPAVVCYQTPILDKEIGERDLFEPRTT